MIDNYASTKSNWFCEKCKIYPEILPISPISRIGTREGKNRFWKRFFSSMAISFAIPIIMGLIFFLWALDYYRRLGLM